MPGDFSRVNPLALLRAHRERPCGHRAAEQRDELASRQGWHGLGNYIFDKYKGVYAMNL